MNKSITTVGNFNKPLNNILSFLKLNFWETNFMYIYIYIYIYIYTDFMSLSIIKYGGDLPLDLFNNKKNIF